MNVYCVKCGGEMEIMRDLGSELRVFPCGCGGNGRRNASQQSVQADETICTCTHDAYESIVNRGHCDRCGKPFRH